MQRCRKSGAWAGLLAIHSGRGSWRGLIAMYILVRMPFVGALGPGPHVWCAAVAQPRSTAPTPPVRAYASIWELGE